MWEVLLGRINDVQFRGTDRSEIQNTGCKEDSVWSLEIKQGQITDDLENQVHTFGLCSKHNVGLVEF